MCYSALRWNVPKSGTCFRACLSVRKNALKGQKLLEKVIKNTDNIHEKIEDEPALTPSPADIANLPPMGMFARIKALIGVMRPKQWTKNGFVFIGLIFAGQLFNTWPLIRATMAFAAFCLASSTIYVLNDIMDLEKDRQHPVKRFRPLASGRVPVAWAWVAMVVALLTCCVLVGVLFFLPLPSPMYASLGGANVLFALTIGAYLIINVFYNIRLKHIVIVDVFCLAAGFVLRTIAGAVVIPVSTSPWLYLVTCFLSLFLGFGKRRHELVLLQGQASSHRKILKEYSIAMLDQMITIVVACTLIAYSLYTIQGQTGHQHLAITIPFVLYGMFRYLYLMYMRMEGGSPDEVLLRDKHILGSVVLCVVTAGFVLYVLPQ